MSSPLSCFVLIARPSSHRPVHLPTQHTQVNASFRSKEDLQNERDVLALMAPWLRDDVITTINRGIVRSVPIFDRIVRSHAHSGGGEELLQHLVDSMCAKVRSDRQLERWRE